MDTVNRYASQDIFIETRHSAPLREMTARGEKDSKPFARQVDGWWVALGIGVRMGRRTPLEGDQTKFNDAGILSTDPWRITHIELLALAEEGEGILESPSAVMRVASEYANTGMPWLLEQLMGEAEPTLALVNRLPKLDELSG